MYGIGLGTPSAKKDEEEAQDDFHKMDEDELNEPLCVKIKNLLKLAIPNSLNRLLGLV